MSGFSEYSTAPYGPGRVQGFMDKTAFCQWVQRQERKYEWREGEVVMMHNASRANGLIVTNLVLAFSGRLDLSKWNAMAVDFGVEVEEATRYPDIIVEPRQADDLKGRRSDLPVLIIEVLSPSSGARDFVEKLAEYQTIPSIEAYIVASQDEPICWLWHRDEAIGFPARPSEISGRDATIKLPARSIEPPMSEIYRGIPDP